MSTFNRFTNDNIIVSLFVLHYCILISKYVLSKFCIIFPFDCYDLVIRQINTNTILICIRSAI